MGREPLAVKLSFEPSRETYFPRGAASSAAGPVGRVMDSEGGFVEIALELKSGFPDEALVLGIVADGGKIPARVRLPGRPKVEVEKSVRPRQKSGGFRGGGASQ